MVASSWTESCKMVRRSEGGNDDDPRDPGGRTSRGVTQREYNIWRRTHPGLPSDVWKAPESAVEAIYKLQYWDPWCDNLPVGIDCEVFDMNVLQGPAESAATLQRAINKPDVVVDGHIGMLTLAACHDANP